MDFLWKMKLEYAFDCTDIELKNKIELMEKKYKETKEHCGKMEKV